MRRPSDSRSWFHPGGAVFALLVAAWGLWGMSGRDLVRTVAGFADDSHERTLVRQIVGVLDGPDHAAAARSAGPDALLRRAASGPALNPDWEPVLEPTSEATVPGPRTADDLFGPARPGRMQVRFERPALPPPKTVG